MKIITEIKVLETDKDFCEIINTAFDPNLEIMQFGEEYVQVEKARELIKGRRFVDSSRGIDIVLGVSQEVGEILGLQYEAFENMQNSIYDYQIENTKLIKKLIKISKLSFIDRLKALFVGIDINTNGELYHE